jgi:hypothetical protein
MLRKLILTGIVGVGILGAGARGAAGESLAAMSVGAAGIEWLPQAVGYDRVVLTVSGPGGTILRQEFAAGKTAALSLFDGKGQRLPDGGYAWQLEVVPAVDRATRKAVAAAREAGDEAALAQLAGRLPKSAIEFGYLRVEGGAFVTAGQTEARTKPSRQSSKAGTSSGGLTNIIAKDQVIADDLIVQGSACVGLDCVNNESFGFDTIRLKENNTRIKFDDTSTGTGFPNHDWQLTANDSASGGANKFSIEDITAATVPVTVTGSAPTNSIFVDSTGRLGLRTATPVLDIHVATGNTPALRLEQNSSGGFTAQTWDVAGNEANFFVRDVTGGSRLPFRIRPGAPTSSIDINASGNVGVGTASPSASLHVARSDGTTQLLVKETSGTAAFRVLGQFSNNGGVQVNLEDTSAFGTGVTWALVNSNATLILSDVGDAVNEFVLTQAGNLTVAGTVTPGSSRTIKEEFSPVDSRDVLRRVLDLPITSWHYKADPGVRHVGPMSEDFFAAFKLGNDDKGISVTDSAGVAFAAIQGLHQEIAARDAEIAALKARLEELAARFEQITAPR